MDKQDIADRISIDGRVANFLLFGILDCCETLEKISQAECQKAGLIGYGKRIQEKLTALKWNIKDLLKYVRKTDLDNQIIFGEDADNTLKLLVLVGDRVGNKPENMQKIFDFIEAMPSEQGIHLNKFYK